MAKKGFKLATWNFNKAGHRKGVPDAIGAAIKRLVDSMFILEMTSQQQLNLLSMLLQNQLSNYFMSPTKR